MKILILSGSGKLGSRTDALARAIEARLTAGGADVTKLELADYKLPSFDAAIDFSKVYEPKVAKFLELTKAADAYVWVTPIYHASYSSLLKTALDWQHFSKADKVVAMASNGGDRSTSAVDQLLQVARSQHLITVPYRVCTDRGDFDESLKITNDDINARIDELCNVLTDLTHKVTGNA
jgi:azobenzene reductase